MSTTTLTLAGNLTAAPTLRYTPGGMAIVEVGVACNDRKKGQNGEWEDDPSFYDLTFFGQQAENVAESCEKGTRVMVWGRLKQDRWKDKNDDSNRSKVKVNVDEVGVSIRWATVDPKSIAKNDPKGSGSAPQGRAQTEDDVEPF